MQGEAYDVNIIFASRQYKPTVCCLAVINVLQQFLLYIVHVSIRQS